MKRIYFFCIMFFITCMPANAENLPILQLDNGVNDISLTLSANYQDLKDVRVDVDSSLLPNWLSIEKSLDVVDVKKGENSEKQLVIKLLVDNPSQEISSLVMPFTLSDKEGHSWSFKALLQVNSNKPTETDLYNNFPNPFNPSTIIRFSLKEDTLAKIVIYNSLGQAVRTLLDDPMRAGMHSLQWNGMDNQGLKAASGVYFYRFTAGGFHKTLKMLIVE